MKSKDSQQEKPGKLLSIQDDDNVEETSDERHTARVIAIWRNVAVACMAAILFILIPSPLVNNAQLAGNHIDYRLLNKVMPKEMTTAQPKIVKAETTDILKRKQADTQIANNNPSTSASMGASADVAPQGKYSIVVASHVTKSNAKAYTEELTGRGFKDVYVHRGAHVKVLMGHYRTREEAMKALNSLNNKDEFSGAWVIDLP